MPKSTDHEDPRLLGDADRPVGPCRDGHDRLFALSPALLCIAGTDGYFKRVNPAFQQTLGHTAAELLSRPFIDFVHPDDRQTTMSEVGKLSKGFPAVHFENRYRHADGSYRWLLWNTTPVPEEGLMYATALDITDRKRSQEKLHALAARMILVEEAERRRIAHGLHDDVGQTLLAAKLNLGELLDEGPLAGDSSGQELQRLLDHAIETTRTLTFELASAALYELGLGSALQSVCERAESESGIQFEPPSNLKDNPIPEQARVLLYRAGQELIRNVVKHSRARRAKVTLSRSGKQVRLTVEDDGCGFEVSNGPHALDTTGGFGLFSIDQHLNTIGGQFEIATSPGAGTRATIIVSVDATGEPG